MTLSYHEWSTVLSLYIYLSSLVSFRIFWRILKLSLLLLIIHYSAEGTRRQTLTKFALSSQWSGYRFSTPTEVRLNIMMSFYPYRKSHYKDNTISRPSRICDGNCMPGKTLFKLRRAQKCPLRINYRAVSKWFSHYSDVIISTMASQITGISIICSSVCSVQRKYQSSRVTGPLCGEFTGDRWIPRSKGQ